jgi:taurine transport system permease protein
MTMSELDLEFQLPGAIRDDDAVVPRERLTRGRLAAITVLALIAVWWLAALLKIVPALFLPSPVAVLKKLVDVSINGFADATLGAHLFASLGRIAAALLIAIVTGVPTGLAMGLSRIARGLLDPLIELYRPIPPLAYLPLVIIWFGIGEGSKIFLIYLAAFAPIAIATAAGVRAVPGSRINAARALGASRLQVITHVVLPSTLPDILTGIRIGLGSGWSTLVAAELVAATRGLGFMIQSASQFLVTDVVVMGILVIAAVAFALELIVRAAQRVSSPGRDGFDPQYMTRSRSQ